MREKVNEIDKKEFDFDFFKFIIYIVNVILYSYII